MKFSRAMFAWKKAWPASKARRISPRATKSVRVSPVNEFHRRKADIVTNRPRASPPRRHRRRGGEARMHLGGRARVLAGETCVPAGRAGRGLTHKSAKVSGLGRSATGSGNVLHSASNCWKSPIPRDTLIPHFKRGEACPRKRFFRNARGRLPARLTRFRPNVSQPGNSVAEQNAAKTPPQHKKHSRE